MTKPVPLPIAAPATPNAGSPKVPCTSEYVKKTLTTLPSAPIHNGVTTSPAARSAVLSAMTAANAM